MTAAPSRERRARLLAIGWAAVLAAALLVGPLAGGAAAADPTPTPTPTDPGDPTATPTPSPTPSPIVIAYRTSLLHSGDFARQYTRYQCVGASLQIMRNMIWSFNNRGPNLQRRLWRIARANSRYTADGGADPYGWATATSLAGQGRYVLIAAPTMAGAVKAAAQGIATTGRPAGIVVWHGAHAWVVTGFEATADPSKTDDYRVVTVRIADPLWPYYRVNRYRIYRPGTRLYMGTLARNFTTYHDARRDDRIEGLFVAIVPLAEGATLPSGAWEPKGGVTTTSTPLPTPTSTPIPTSTPSPTDAPAESPTATPDPTSTPTASPTEPAPTPSPSA